MLRPSKKLALALEAIVDIALHGTMEPVQSQSIGERLNLPKRYLEQVMQQLVKAKILRGVRGPRGGYRLARERRRISIAEVVKVIGPEHDGDLEVHVSKSEIGLSVMEPFWHGIEQDFLNQLDEITIDDLCQRAKLETAATGSSSDKDCNFSI